MKPNLDSLNQKQWPWIYYYDNGDVDQCKHYYLFISFDNDLQIWCHSWLAPTLNSFYFYPSQVSRQFYEFISIEMARGT